MTRQARNPECVADGREPEAKLFDLVAANLDANDWTYDAHPDGGYFSIDYSGETGNLRVIVDTFEDADTHRILVLSIFPVRVPVERRLAVAELLTRISYGSMIGSFELDFSDGEVRMKTLADTGAAPMPDACFERALHANLYSAGRYYAAILSVAFGEVTPVRAVEKLKVVPVAAQGTVQ